MAAERTQVDLEGLDAPTLRRLVADIMDVFDGVARAAVARKRDPAANLREMLYQQGRADVARQVTYMIRGQVRLGSTPEGDGGHAHHT